MPHQRKLSTTEQKIAENLLELNANKKMVQDKLVKDTGQLGVTVHLPSCISIYSATCMESPPL